MKKFSFVISLCFVFLIGLTPYSKADQVGSHFDIQSHLRSWNSGPVKEKIVSFGNSSGDLAMLEVTAASGLPSMVCILDHDDPEREFEYHKSNLLKTAKKNAWTIVSMKRDFKALFPFHP